MQFARALGGASYTFATTYARCADAIQIVPLSSKCYEANALTDGEGETV